MRTTCVAALLFLLAAGDAALASPHARPRAHTITGVLNHKQLNGLHCGAAAVEIAFDYWGPDISQREIVDVARTSSEGTWTFDIVRAGHFSALSAAQGRFYPHDAPSAGYSGRGLGYAAFGHSAQAPWLDELKGLIAQDIPVILLMWYAPEAGSGGHYRVLVGYDDDLSELYFMDPWERDLRRVANPDGTVTWTYAEFAIGWDYGASGIDVPYFGAALLPWQLALQASRPRRGEIFVSADITYPCLAPFDCSSFPASSSTAEIMLPPGARLVSGQAVVSLGAMPAGSQRTASWRVTFDGDPAGASIEVKAGGLISGAVPEAYWSSGHVYYPAYSYTDLIGGEARLTL